jgi:hypothetical protein
LPGAGGGKRIDYYRQGIYHLGDGNVSWSGEMVAPIDKCTKNPSDVHRKPILWYINDISVKIFKTQGGKQKGRKLISLTTC